MNKTQEQIIKGYLANIGRVGGKRSSRKLDRKTAQEMVRVREAKRAFHRYYFECFWSFDPDLKITRDDIQWVAEQLMKHGSIETWKVGKKLCQ